MATLDHILRDIGEFGKAQRWVFTLLNLFTICQCCQMYLLVFVGDKPQWECPDVSLVDVADQQKGSPCNKNGTSCQNATFAGQFSSIASEWGLICDQEYKINVAQSIVLAGCLTGTVVLGRIADSRGRKFAITLMESSASLLSLASAFAQSYYQFVMLRFFAMAFWAAGGMAIFVLISEILGPNKRDMMLTVHQGCYACGFVVLALLAYYIPNWRVLTMAISSLSLICVPFLYTLWESPQWLLVKGRLDETKEILKRIARENGTELQEKHLDNLSESVPVEKTSQSHDTIQEGYLNLIVTLSSAWLLLGMLYNGLSFSSKSTSSNKYISFSLSGLVEIPSLFISVILLKSGRKTPLISLVLVCGFSCFLCALLFGIDKSLVPQFGMVMMVLGMVGKFGIAAAYNVMYIFSADLFPAAVRSSSMGICSTTASAGGVLAPLLIYLGHRDKRLPMFLFGVGATCSVMIVSTLPEGQKEKVGAERPKEE